MQSEISTGSNNALKLGGKRDVGKKITSWSIHLPRVSLLWCVAFKYKPSGVSASAALYVNTPP